MSPQPTPDPSSQDITPARQRFLDHLAALSINPAARDYYVRWAEAWTKALGPRSAERTHAFFDALGRSAHLFDYLDYLALERQVSASTQKQALNAMVFLTKKVFGVEEFTIDKPAHGHAYRPRPPRTRRRLHHHDLPPRHQTPGRRWAEPARPPVNLGN